LIRWIENHEVTRSLTITAAVITASTNTTTVCAALYAGIFCMILGMFLE